jgi:hypothetical protein
MNLTEKQKKFTREYLKELNATKAARLAGYSNKTAYSIGHENLNKPEVRKEIERLRVEISQKSQISTLEIISEVRLIKEASLLSGDFKTSLRALELLGKHLGCWETVDCSTQDLGDLLRDAKSSISLLEKDLI